MKRWALHLGLVSALGLSLTACSATPTVGGPPDADPGYSALLKGTILLTDDDGWDAPGIRALYDELGEQGFDVVIVAPLHNQSGTSASLTTEPSLSVTDPSTDGDIHAVDGTPADSVLLGVTGILDAPPSLVISGINLGYNVGDDLNYSGTVGAAVTASLQGLPALAVSATAPAAGEDPYDSYRVVADFVVELLLRLDESPGAWPVGAVLNVNYPVGASPTRVEFTTIADARGMAADYENVGDGMFEREYVPDSAPAAGTDITAVNDGAVSVSAVSANRGSPAADYTALSRAVKGLTP